LFQKMRANACVILLSLAFKFKSWIWCLILDPH